MSDTLITIIAIFLFAVLMFIFPLMSVSERNDDIAQTVVQTATSEFVKKVATYGSIKPNDYNSYVQELYATGNTYEIEIEVQHLDENPGKKQVTTSADLIGENVYYSTYTTEILDKMFPTSGPTADTGENYVLKKGDNIIVTVKNTNKTIAQLLRTFFYRVTGQGTYQVAASASSMIVNDGK